MKAEPAAALIELMRAAIKQVTGSDPEGPVTVTLIGRHAGRIEKAYEQTNGNNPHSAVSLQRR